MRMIAGKVMMDRDAPEALMDTAQRGYDESKALIERWRGPRPARLRDHAALRGDLDAGATGGRGRARARISATATSRPTPNENKAEIARVAALFPEARSYIDVYARAGLPGRRSVFGHCIHLQDERSRRARRKPAPSPRSARRRIFSSAPACLIRRGSAQAGVRIALATDVGGGTSYSMLRTAAEGYKVLQLNGQSWPALRPFTG